MNDADRTPAAVLVHLTGARRGLRQHLSGGAIRVGTAEDSEVRFPPQTPGVAPRHATLIREADRWVLWSEPQEAVFVDGARTDQHSLRPGDVVTIGHGGPKLRFRLQDEPPGEYKTMAQALHDCVDCARHGSDSFIGRVALLLNRLPRELLTETAPTARFLVLGALGLLALTVVALTIHSVRLERRLVDEARRLATIEDAVRSAQVRLDDAELREVVSQLEAGLTQRIEALELRSEATRRVVSEAAGSVVLLQGAYTFADTASGRPVRIVLGPDGRPSRGPGGGPLVGVGGQGPLLENLFTGSAFVVDGRREKEELGGVPLLVTNRHLVQPWNFDSGARRLVEQGYRPELRLVGYLPSLAEALELEVVAVSDRSDLAVLAAPELPATATALPLGDSPPEPGDEVVVLGYPTGIDALLARTKRAFVDSLMRGEKPDFWTIAQRLSGAGLVRPLATGGIVGQVTRTSVVYDAETTRGGSGGPVLDLEGRVVAVTVGIMEAFGGSNLGIPADEVRQVLREAGVEADELPDLEAGAEPDPESPVEPAGAPEPHW